MLAISPLTGFTASVCGILRPVSSNPCFLRMIDSNCSLEISVGSRHSPRKSVVGGLRLRRKLNHAHAHPITLLLGDLAVSGSINGRGTFHPTRCCAAGKPPAMPTPRSLSEVDKWFGDYALVDVLRASVDGLWAGGGPNQVVKASASPCCLRSPTHATYPSGRINTAVGAETTPTAGSSHAPP